MRLQKYLAVSLLSCCLVSIAHSQPKAHLTETSFSFGTVAQGTVVEHQFQIQNQGDQPLVVHSVKTTCGCTAAVPPGGPIPPNGSGPVTVSFDSTGFDGPREKTVRIYTNDPNESELTVSLQGTIRGGIELSPKRVQIGEVRKSDSKASRLIYVSLRDQSEQTIKDVSSLSESLVVKNKQITETGGQFEVEFDPSKLDGVFMERVVITALEDGKEIPYILPVYGKVIGSVIVEPKTVALGMIDPRSDVAIERQVKIASPSPNDSFQIKSFSVSDPSISAELQEVQKSVAYLVKLKVIPSKVKKDIQATLSVVTSDPVEPTVNVTIYGVVLPSK